MKKQPTKEIMKKDITMSEDITKEKNAPDEYEKELLREINRIYQIGKLSGNKSRKLRDYKSQLKGYRKGKVQARKEVLGIVDNLPLWKFKDGQASYRANCSVYDTNALLNELKQKLQGESSEEDK